MVCVCFDVHMCMCVVLCNVFCLQLGGSVVFSSWHVLPGLNPENYGRRGEAN